jgi:hypothetical protein
VKLAVAALAVAGCWTSTPAATPVAPPDPQTAMPERRMHPSKSPCELAVDHVMEVVGSDLEKTLGDKVDPFHAAAIESCTELHWSPEMLECLGNVDQSASLAQCESMLTPDQQKDVFRRISEILSASPATP